MDDRTKVVEAPIVKAKQNAFVTFGAVFLLIIIGVAFLAMPMADGIRMVNNDSNEFGRYGNERIVATAGSYFTMQAESIWNQYGRYLNDVKSVYQMAFNQAMQRAGRLDEGKRLGIEVSQSRRLDILKKSFVKEDGSFDRVAFSKIDEVKKQLILNEIADDVIIEEYDRVMLEMTKRNQTVSNFIANPSTEERKFRGYVFNSDAFPASQVAKYAVDNAKLFTKYNLRRYRFHVKEEADDFVKALKSNALIDEAVKNYKFVDDGHGHDYLAIKGEDVYSYTLKQELKPEDLTALELLKAKEFSNPLQIVGGFTVYYLENDPEFFMMKTADDEDIVRNYISSYEKSLIVAYINDNLKDVSTDNLAEKARDLGANYFETDYITSIYGYKTDPNNPTENAMIKTKVDSFKNAFNDSLQGGLSDDLLKSKTFFVEAFKLADNSVSLPITIDSDIFTMMVLVLDDKREITKKDVKLDDVNLYVEDETRNDLVKNITDSKRAVDNFEKTWAIFEKGRV